MKKPTITEPKSSHCPPGEGHLRYSCQAIFAVADESIADGIAWASIPARIWEAGCDLWLTIPSCKLGEAIAMVPWEVRDREREIRLLRLSLSKSKRTHLAALHWKINCTVGARGCLHSFWSVRVVHTNASQEFVYLRCPDNESSGLQPGTRRIAAAQTILIVMIQVRINVIYEHLL